MMTTALRIVMIAAFSGAGFLALTGSPDAPVTFRQAQAAPTPAAAFDQAAAIAKLREQIKGREREPAGTVFKNIQTMKDRPAGQLLAVMQMGYARSLGVDCTHCHVPDKWELEDRPQKQIAREMSAMVAKINGESLKAIKNLKSPQPTVNCTTCHRGQVKPALAMPDGGRE